ncbi:MAG: hypothetical protein PHP53_06740 [Prolixibacteraceae bacterium]|nr:hypothetical protein [Prolixibacteraceae bacterium]
MKNNLFTIVLILGSTICAAGQTEKSVNNINGGMPNRISMNVTVPKQTQGATFGEKVNAGLNAAGSYVIFPNKQAFLINSSTHRVSQMSVSEVNKVNAGLHATGGALAQGASLLGGALPGGAVISAAVSSVGGGKVIWQIRDAGNDFKMPSSLADGEYELTINLDAGSKDAAKIQVKFGIVVEKQTYKVISVN